jgi:prepilin-type N-terminal cleavage/methylation domain-containing protein
MHPIHFYKKIRGFTLVEMLIAISILSLSILGTFAAVSGSFRSANFAEDQIIASYLGQEGLEFVRNWRDENSIKNIRAMETGGSQAWWTGIAQAVNDPCYPSKTCTVDSPLKVVTACSGSGVTCPYIKLDTSSHLYGYTSWWADTKYRRSVYFTSISPTEMQVTVDVYWQGQGVAKTFSVTEIFRNI